MNKIITSFIFAVSLMGLSACGSDQPEGVGTSADIIVNNRAVVMGGAAAPSPSIPAPVAPASLSPAELVSPAVPEAQGANAVAPTQPAVSQNPAVDASE